MASPVGTNTVNSISRRFILPEVTDNIYGGNLMFFRLIKANKRMVRGGYQIEAPLMYSRFGAGGMYTGLDLLDITPSDTVKNGAWDWKQAYVPVTVDGLTLIKVDQAEAVLDFLKMYWAQAEMEMAEILGTSLWSTGTGKNIDGLGLAVDSTGTYGGLSRATNTWWASSEDTTTATMSLVNLQTFFGGLTKGGRHPTIIVSRQDQYNRFYGLNTGNQRFPIEPAGRDEQLAQAGFSNLLFNGVPWAVDSHVPDGTGAGPNSSIFFLNEDYISFCVSPRGDFYMEDFQTAINQDAMSAKMFWAGNLVLTNCALQGKMTFVTTV